MKAMNSRSIVAVTGIVGCLALVVLVFSIASTGKTPACPHCGSQNAQLRTSEAKLTTYFCPACQKHFTGPARHDIPWAEAIHEWLDDTPVMGER